MMRLTADNITIDNDEGRFILVISTEEIGTVRVNFQACALEFEDEVRRALRPYALEAVHARMSLPPAYHPDNETTGYALDDPKHPTYYERMVG